MKTNNFLLLLMVMFGVTVSASAQTSVNYKHSYIFTKFFRISQKTDVKTGSLSKANPNLPSSTTYLDWMNNSWDTSSKSLFIYDNNDRVQIKTRQDFDGTTFNTGSRELFVYDNAGRVIELINQAPNGTGWDNMARDTMAYSPMGIEILSLRQSWMNNMWVNTFGNQTIITYNTNNQMTEMLNQALDSAGNWEDESKIELTLNSSGNVNGGTIYQIDSTGNWAPLFRLTNASFKNNDFNFPVSYTLQVPVPIIGWMNVSRNTTYYNSSNLPDSVLTERFVIAGQNWENLSLEKYTYDSKGNQVLSVSNTWEDGAWVMEYGQKDSIVYNTQGNIESQTTKFWLDSAAGWENSQMFINTYGEISGLAKSDHSGFSSYNIYPNPAREMLKIELQGVKADRVKISVIDLTGRIIYTDNIVTNSGLLNATINTSEFKTGIYIMQIQSGNQVVNQKIVKE